MPSEGPPSRESLQQSQAGLEEEMAGQEELHLLKRLLVRTSLSSQGQAPSLDPLLDRLRHQLRGDGSSLAELRQLQELLDRELINLDEHKAGQARALAEAMTQLIGVLRSNDTFENQRAALKRLERLPADYEGLRDHLPGWLKTLATLEAEALGASLPHCESEITPGITLGERVRGLFRRPRDAALEAPEPQDAQALASNAKSEFALFASDTDTDGAASCDPERMQLTRRIAELLSTLLGKLTLAPTDQARVASLQTRLEGSRAWGDLHHALHEVGEVAGAAIQQGQKEFETFLKLLDERLATLQQHVTAQSDACHERLGASQALNETLTRDLAQLGEDAHRIDDINQLKQSVSGQVARLTDVFRSFRQKERQREEALDSQVAAMQEKLATMEAHSEQMQEQLQEARGLALKDTLTQLANRLAFQDRMEFEFSRWQRYGHPVTLAVIDIDHFKQVNDRYGHTAGDRVIQLVGRCLSEHLRSTDFIARYGGEEFVVLLPETSVESAVTIVDQLRVRVGQLPFHFQKTPVKVTFSAGLAAFGAGETAASIFEQADKALYQAKAAGRDRSQVAGTGSNTPL